MEDGKYKLRPVDLLLMALCWSRLYPNPEALGSLFGVDKSTASRDGRRVLRVLRLLGEETLGWPEPPQRGQGRSLEKLLEECPDLWAIVDATEQRIQRPGNGREQRAHYSGKKKAHTRKAGIVVNEHGRVRAVTASVPGSQRDLRLAIGSGVIERILEGIGVLGDAAFDGLQNYYLQRSVGTPHKARRKPPLQPDQKLANRELASTWIVVENTLCHMKHFKVLAYPFRHVLERYDDAFRAAGGIVNDRIDRRLCLGSTA